jgi:hypothetical protein
MTAPLWDIRWHNAESHLLGHLVLKGTEREALVYAVDRLLLPSVRSVRILRGSTFIHTLEKGEQT